VRRDHSTQRIAAIDTLLDTGSVRVAAVDRKPGRRKIARPPAQDIDRALRGFARISKAAPEGRVIIDARDDRDSTQNKALHDLVQAWTRYEEKTRGRFVRKHASYSIDEASIPHALACAALAHSLHENIPLDEVQKRMRREHSVELSLGEIRRLYGVLGTPGRRNERGPMKLAAEIISRSSGLGENRIREAWALYLRAREAIGTTKAEISERIISGFRTLQEAGIRVDEAAWAEVCENATRELRRVERDAIRIKTLFEQQMPRSLVKDERPFDGETLIVWGRGEIVQASASTKRRRRSPKARAR
jgi:hypothetical protein